MEISTRAIVLRRRDQGESDRRLTLLTEEFGKIDVIAKGARKPASRLASVSEPLSCARFTLAPGRRNRYVTQAQPTAAFKRLRTDFERLAFALSLVELYGILTPYDSPDAEAYRTLVASLEALETAEAVRAVALWGQLQLMQISGFMPEWRDSAVSGAPVRGDMRCVSAQAGGVILPEESARFRDARMVSHQVVIGIYRTAELDAPPSRLKNDRECLATLLPFWRAIADSPIPATEQALQSPEPIA